MVGLGAALIVMPGYAYPVEQVQPHFKLARSMCCAVFDTDTVWTLYLAAFDVAAVNVMLHHLSLNALVWQCAAHTPSATLCMPCSLYREVVE
jgi:hypothetical protein